MRDEFGDEVEALVNQAWRDESPARSAGARLGICTAVFTSESVLRRLLPYPDPSVS